MKKINVCLSPALYKYYSEDNTIVVMLDAIRASATICTAFMNDVELIIPVSDKDLAKDYRNRGYIIAGEREGEKLKDFDYGNSPFNFTEENIKGKKLAFTTTNGTQAVNLVKNGKNKNIELIIGSFINISALTDFLNKQKKDILILCSGWKNSVNIEDSLLAGRIVDLLIKKDKFEVLEAANLVYNLFLSAGDSYYDFVMANSPRLNSKSKKLEKDFRYCLTEDLTDVIPYLKGNELVV
ncbi:MAG: 2-phosphosulfolactate phosphatase [Bacteroidales bacterium]|nr:2-phosphosulfolactate phosphatase [Bacteroidales bacterium]